MMAALTAADVSMMAAAASAVDPGVIERFNLKLPSCRTPRSRQQHRAYG